MACAVVESWSRTEGSAEVMDEFREDRVELRGNDLLLSRFDILFVDLSVRASTRRDARLTASIL